MIFTGRYSISSFEGPIEFARQAADGLTIAVYMILASTRRAVRVPSLVLVPVLAVALLAAGSRGPVLGAIVGQVTLFAVLARDRTARRRLVLAAVGGVATAILAAQLVPGQSITRSLSFLTGSGSGLSSNGRTQAWSLAWNHFLAHPALGLGTGSYFKISGVDRYPHNLVLEVAVELGLVGLVVLAGFLVSTGLALSHARTLQRRGDLQVAVVIALFASALVNAMFSGDIQTNSAVWLTAGLGLGLAQRARLAGADPSLDAP